jgi:hypothetical protein
VADDHAQPARWGAGRQCLPHFLRGITRRRYPSALGNGPIPNFVAGWAGLVLTAILLYWAHVDRHPGPAFAAAAAGVFLIGLFHAGPGAFGRREVAGSPEGATTITAK